MFPSSHLHVSSSCLSDMVSKRPSGPQQSHLFIRFWLKKTLKRKKFKNTLEIFSLCEFWKSFVFSVEFSVALRVIKETTKWNETLGSSYLYICQWHPTKKQIIFALYCFLTNPSAPSSYCSFLLTASYNTHLKSHQDQSIFQMKQHISAQNSSQQPYHSQSLISQVDHLYRAGF